MGSGYRPISVEGTWKKVGFIDDLLARQLTEGSVSLVVGAGVSMGFGLPSWEDLIERMYLSKNELFHKSQKSSPQLAQELKSKYFTNDELGYSALVRDSLYKSFSPQPSTVLASPLLQAIGSFLVSSIRGRAGSLVSFNFDDLIERYLRLLGFVVRSEAKSPYWHKRSDMQVLHPHGLLPSDAATECSPIVFTEEDYDTVISEFESNSWNQSIRSVLLGSTPIFLGLSGDDHRLRSLLSSVRADHPAALEKHRYWGVRPTFQGDTESNIDRWRKLGIAPRFLGGYDSLAPWLLSICQRSASSIA